MVATSTSQVRVRAETDEREADAGERVVRIVAPTADGAVERTWDFVVSGDAFPSWAWR
jgi:hypothetical protein